MKKPSPKKNLLKLWEFLKHSHKILHANTINFRQSVKISIDGIFTNYHHFKVQRGQIQIPEIFGILQNR